MAQDAKVVSPPKADKKETKQAKPKTTIVSVIREVAVKPSKDRAELVEKVLAVLKARGITKNSKGKMVTQANVASLLNAIVRDIVAERSKAKGGWWSLQEVKEVEGTNFQIVPKPQ